MKQKSSFSIEIQHVDCISHSKMFCFSVFFGYVGFETRASFWVLSFLALRCTSDTQDVIFERIRLAGRSGFLALIERVCFQPNWRGIFKWNGIKAAGMFPADYNKAFIWIWLTDIHLNAASRKWNTAIIHNPIQSLFHTSLTVRLRFSIFFVTYITLIESRQICVVSDWLGIGKTCEVAASWDSEGSINKGCGMRIHQCFTLEFCFDIVWNHDQLSWECKMWNVEPYISSMIFLVVCEPRRMVAGGADRDSKLACFFQKNTCIIAGCTPLTPILFILYFSASLFLCMIWALYFWYVVYFHEFSPWVFCLGWAVARFLILPTQSLSPHASRGLTRCFEAFALVRVITAVILKALGNAIVKECP